MVVRGQRRTKSIYTVGAYNCELSDLLGGGGFSFEVGWRAGEVVNTIFRLLALWVLNGLVGRGVTEI